MTSAPAGVSGGAANALRGHKRPSDADSDEEAGRQGEMPPPSKGAAGGARAAAAGSLHSMQVKGVHCWDPGNRRCFAHESGGASHSKRPWHQVAKESEQLALSAPSGMLPDSEHGQWQAGIPPYCISTHPCARGTP